ATAVLRSRPMRRSQTGLGGHPAGFDGLGERLVVPLVLLCVGICELKDRAVEARPGAEVGGDRDAVAAAGVRTGERPPAETSVGGHPLGDHLLDLCRALPVAKLASVDISFLVVQSRIDVNPAK